MKLENYDIIAYRCEWNTSTNLSDVNFFSTVQPESVIQIDLKQYLIDMGKLNYTFDSSDNNGNANTFFYETSDVSYTISGGKNNEYLIDFFGIYQDTTYIKHKIELIDKTTNVSVHQGLVSQELIETNYSSDRQNNKIIKITALGFEGETKEYYKNKLIKHNDTEIVWLDNRLQDILEIKDGYLRQGSSVFEIFRQNLDSSSISFQFEQDLYNWYMIRNPFLGKRNETIAGQSDVWIKSSYERMRAGGCTRWELIEKLCNAMGWVFYFYDRKFHIKNRSSDYNTQEKVLDFRLFGKDWTLTKSPSSLSFDNVIVLDGILFGANGSGGGDQRGARFQIFTNQDYVGAGSEVSFKYCGRWWKRIGSSNGSGWGLQYRPAGWRLQRYWSENNENWTYNIREYTNGINYGAININISKDKILFIDSGSTKISQWVYDSFTGINRPFDEGGSMSDTELAFSGNFGNSLYRIYNNSVVGTYEDYVQSSTFTNNFLKFFSSKLARKIKFKYPEIITNPLQIFTFVNDNGKLAGTWTLNTMSIDFLNQETELELQLKED